MQIDWENGGPQMGFLNKWNYDEIREVMPQQLYLAHCKGKWNTELEAPPSTLFHSWHSASLRKCHLQNRYLYVITLHLMVGKSMH